MSLEVADGIDWSSGPDGVAGCGWPRSLFHSQTKLGFGEEWRLWMKLQDLEGRVWGTRKGIESDNGESTKVSLI